MYRKHSGGDDDEDNWAVEEIDDDGAEAEDVDDDDDAEIVRFSSLRITSSVLLIFALLTSNVHFLVSFTLEFITDACHQVF